MQQWKDGLNEDWASKQLKIESKIIVQKKEVTHPFILSYNLERY